MRWQRNGTPIKTGAFDFKPKAQTVFTELRHGLNLAGDGYVPAFQRRAEGMGLKRRRAKPGQAETKDGG